MVVGRKKGVARQQDGQEEQVAAGTSASAWLGGDG